MATAAEQVGSSQEMMPAVVLAVGPSPICSECAFHIPHVTKVGGWCACAAADLRWQQIAAGQAGCREFAG